MDSIVFDKNIAIGKPNLFWGKATDIASSRNRIIWRFFEMLAGLLSFGTLILLTVFSFFLPAAVAVFVIIFDVLWLMRALSLSLHLIVSYRKVRKFLKIDWLEKLEDMKEFSAGGGSAFGGKSELKLTSWKDVWHLVILPMYKEPKEIIEETLRALAKSNYPHERLLVVVATEERGGEDVGIMAKNIADRFSAGGGSAFGGKNDFAEILVTSHPANIPGEIAGKGSNEAWAAREAIKLLIQPRGIDPKHVMVSSFDIDTRVYPQYFSCLTYTFLNADNPLRTSYQPIPLYNNNIWEAPMFSRLVATGNTIWQLIQQVRPEQMETFSSHSMSLDSLIKIGFWNTKVVSEDSLIFYQAFLAFEGNYKVVPLFYPVSLDANIGDNLISTIQNVYRQQRRWAYGAEKIPYLFYGFLKTNKISLRKKLFHLWVILDGFWSWACSALIIFAFGWLPTTVGGEEFKSTVLAANLPYVTSFLLSIAMFGIGVNAFVSFLLLPPKPKHVSRFVLVSFVLQWAFLPIIIIVFGSLPALDAQLRLLLGRYMGFWVTPKGRNPKV
ncbi:MAG: glycosyltransferase family 2 protein [bacterium]|nr:glycosyltransferase family 2 protein [bacterium]